MFDPSDHNYVRTPEEQKALSECRAESFLYVLFSVFILVLNWLNKDMNSDYG